MRDKDLIALNLLGRQIVSCRSCYLNKNGVQKPFFTNRSKYVMLLKSPMSEDCNFYDYLCETITKNGLNLSDFAILGTVQCFCVNNGKTVNPSELHRRVCYDWLEQYFTLLKPEKVISFGNIPMHTLTGRFDGIKEKNSEVVRVKVGGHVTKAVLSICPSAAIYSDKNKQMFEESFEKFVRL